MSYADKYRHHVAEVEQAAAVIVARQAYHKRQVSARWWRRPPTGRSVPIEFIVDKECDADGIVIAAKNARDRHAMLATMYGLGALLDVIEPAVVAATEL